MAEAPSEPLNEYGRPIRKLCFTEEQDRQLALGHPHLVRLVDRHPDDRKPEKNAQRVIENKLSYHVAWPRGVAQRVARAALIPGLTDPKRARPDDFAMLAEHAPMSPDEARKALALVMSRRGVQRRPWCVALPLLLEAQLGTELVVDAMVGELEKLPTKRFVVDERDLLVADLAFQIGFLLERLTPERRAHHRARLEAVHDAALAAIASGEGNGHVDLRWSIERVLRGSQTQTLRGLTYCYLERYVFFDDDPEHLRTICRDKSTVAATLDVRFVYLAGTEILEGLAIKPLADRVPAFLEDLGMIRHPEVVGLFLDYVGKKSAKDIPMQWMKDHADFARPILERIARGKGARAERAALVLGAIGAGSAATPEPSVDTRRVSPAPATTPDSLSHATVPPILAAPPWRSAPAREPKALSLAPLDLPEAIDWRPGDPLTFELSPHIAKWSADDARDWLKKSAGWTQIPAEYLAPLPDDESLTLWNDSDKPWWAQNEGSLLAILRRFGERAIPGVIRFASRDFTRAEALALRTRAASLAPIAARALASKRHHDAARAWLTRFSTEAMLALVPEALGRATRARTHARDALRLLEATLGRAAMLPLVQRHGDAARAAFEAFLDRDPRQDVPTKLSARPPFVDLATLPAPTVDGAPLPPEAVDELVTMLTFCALDEPYVGVAEVRAACDATSLARFAWELFSQWLRAGAPADASWAFAALGHFGDDDAVRRLEPMVRAWPGQSAHARAVLGLDVLRAIGSDLALMHLAGIARKVKFKGIQNAARERIDAIAETRGLTPDQLEDRLVPDLGLDAKGELSLALGARTLTVTFDETLTPRVRDERGRLATKLSRSKSDDPELAAAAEATFKALQKDAKALARTHVLRLETAMARQRRWSALEHRMFFAEHPLMRHLARRLVWGVFAQHALAETFRVDESGALASVDDTPFELAPDAVVGLVHPLEVPPALLDRWGRVFGDYELVQPFAQLARETYVRTDSEVDATALTRFEGRVVPTRAVLGLRDRGWYAGPPQDSGGVWAYHLDVEREPGTKPAVERPSTSTDHDPRKLAEGTPALTARLFVVPGILASDPSYAPEQTLAEVVLTPRDDTSARGESFATFGALSRVAFSELIRDVERLFA